MDLCYEGAMLRYLKSWIDQLRWQRLVPFQNLGFMLLDHVDGILNYCRKVRFGVVEAINGNIKTLLRRGRGYKNLTYLLLKAQRMAITKTEFIVLASETRGKTPTKQRRVGDTWCKTAFVLKESIRFACACRSRMPAWHSSPHSSRRRCPKRRRGLKLLQVGSFCGIL